MSSPVAQRARLGRSCLPVLLGGCLTREKGEDLEASPGGSLASPTSPMPRASLPPSCFCWRNFPVIDPNDSTFLIQWDVVSAVIILVTAIVTPFETAFLEPQLNWLFLFDRLVDLSFAVDMVLQFFVAIPDPKHPERLVKDPRRIARSYLQGWFWVDLCGLLPVDLYVIMAKERRIPQLQGGLNTLRNIRLLRLIRVLRLSRFSHIVDRWHTSLGFSYANLSLAKFVSATMLCCHWMACLWGGLGLRTTQDGQHSWLSALEASKGGPEGLYEGPANVYGIALYWSIVTLTSIGYGDITPQTGLEYGVATLCTSLMASIWAYVIGAVCGIVSNMHPHELNFKRTLDDLNWLMADRGMPQEMCRRLRRYFHETREMNRQRVEQDVIAQMSPKLQGEFAHFMHKKWITRVWYLKNMNQEVIVWAARNLTMGVYSPHEEVLQDRTLFIVRRGLCAFKGKVLVTGDIWGEDMLLSNPHLRETAKARSLSYLSVLMLHVMDLVEIVANFPEARTRVRWAQLQIGLVRGVKRIAEVTKELEASGKIKRAELTGPQRMRLFEDILHGRFDRGETAAEDYFGLDAETPGRSLRNRSMATLPEDFSTRHVNRSGSRRSTGQRSLSYGSCGASDSPVGAASPVRRRSSPQMEELASLVLDLKESVQELNARMDRGGPSRQGSHNVGGSFADFGVMSRASISKQVSLTTHRHSGNGRSG